jgi:hypothetical protein
MEAGPEEEGDGGDGQGEGDESAMVRRPSGLQDWGWDLAKL